MQTRNTRIRKQLIDIFNASVRPFSVGDLLTQIKANKTTLYREVTTFVAAGYLTEIDLGDGIKRYELASMDHHHHLICLKCKSIADIKIKEELIIPKSKFKILRHNLEFFGYCQNCAI